MSWWWWVVAALLALGALYLSQTAGRLDRLHIRVDNAKAALDAQLLRRSSVALELAASGLLDPASSLLLTQAAHDARTVAEDGREQAENDLTRALDAALPDERTVSALAHEPSGSDLVEELAAVARRVELGQAFLDDAVRSCAMVRRRPLVRVFRLAGRAPWPAGLSIDARPPDGLADAA